MPKIRLNLGLSLSKRLPVGLGSYVAPPADWRYSVTGIEAAFNYSGATIEDTDKVLTLTDIIPQTYKTTDHALYTRTAPADANRPTLSGKGIVYSSGQWLDSTTSDDLAILFSGLQPFTVFFVGTAAGGFPLSFGGNAVNDSFAFYSKYISNWAAERRTQSAGAFLQGSATTTLGELYSYTIVFDGTKMDLYFNGVFDGTVANTIVVAYNRMSFGSNWNGGRDHQAPFAGTAYEWMFCSVAVEPAEIAAVSAQLLADAVS